MRWVEGRRYSSNIACQCLKPDQTLYPFSGQWIKNRVAFREVLAAISNRKFLLRFYNDLLAIIMQQESNA